MRSYLSPYKTNISLKRDYHVFAFEAESGLRFRIDKYIRSFLSEISQQSFQDANFNHIKQLWPTASRFYEGAYDLTIQILNSGLDRHSFLDTNEYKTVAFRLKMLCRSLQSRDQLVKYKFMNLDNAQCPKCREEETPEHIFTCPDTILQFSTILDHTCLNLHKSLNQYWNTHNPRNLLDTPYTETYSQEILNLIMPDHSFLQDTQSKGLANLNTIAQIEASFPTAYPSARWIYIHAIASFTMALNSVVWKPRTAQVMQENDRNQRNARAN